MTEVTIGFTIIHPIPANGVLFITFPSVNTIS